MKIAFWSNVHGQAATTSNILAVSLLTAIQKNEVALLQSHFTLNNLSLPLIGMDILPDSFRDTGIDALMRDYKSKPLSEDIVKTDAIAVPGLSRNYNLYVGTGKANETDYEKEMLAAHRSIIKSVDEYHDYTFIDVRSGYRSVSQSIIESADAVVVCLDQNTLIIDRYFKKPVHSDNIYYLIGNYDESSKYNIRNLSKKYPALKNRTGMIYHNSEFMDSLNDGKVAQFMLKNNDCTKASVNYEFIQSVKNCIRLLGIERR